MDLLLDIGNTHLKWSDANGLKQGRVSHRSISDLAEIFSRDWSGMARPASVWVSNVAGKVVATPLSDWIKREWGIEPIYLKSEAEALGVTNGYREPEQLGVDRWLAMIAARALSQRPLIVVDCGSATTIDVLDAAGRHRGGLILPGIETMRECLLEKTAIPYCEDAASAQGPADNTAQGIKAGALLATACAVEKTQAELQAQTEEEALTILTGGAARALIECLQMPIRHEPNLVLHGLAEMVERTAP